MSFLVPNFSFLVCGALVAVVAVIITIKVRAQYEPLPEKDGVGFSRREQLFMNGARKNRPREIFVTLSFLSAALVFASGLVIRGKTELCYLALVPFVYGVLANELATAAGVMEKLNNRMAELEGKK